ncbi:hypothetical protein ACIGO8_04905 [Streptomyces sp. NPDC053493]|uniref:hypothetical protein n=1 Tax=Streptomyces sp. NPDC053493 TaxID=3365705 RepID=UPI0037D5AEEB
MTALKIALLALGVLSCVLGVLVLPSVSSARSRVGRLKELEDIGIETEAQVVSVRQGTGGGSRASVTLKVGAAGGDVSQRTQWMTLTPGLAAGNAYPVVRHPQFSGQFEPGTKADVARKRRNEETATIPRLRRYVVSAVVIGAGLIAAGVLL